MLKTILITGGTGFLGSNLCKILIANENCKIICVDNNFTGTINNIKELFNSSRFEFIEHDIINPLKISQKIDEIYNLACPASPQAYQGENAIYTTKTCVIGALNMLELARENNAKIMQASTSEVYGNPKIHPQTEDYFGNVNPNGIRSCYDEGKRCAESIFFDYHRNYGVKTKVIRIFNTYGPFMNSHDGRVISNFICQALRGEDLTIYGDGLQTRSFCYADDLIKAMELMMQTDDNFIGPINLGNPEEYTIQDVAQMVITKINPQLGCQYKSMPSDDPVRRKPDISLAKTMLKWQPKTTLDEGLNRTIEYFKHIVLENNA